MVMRSPIFPTSKASFEDLSFSTLKIFKLRNKNILENKTLYLSGELTGH